MKAIPLLLLIAGMLVVAGYILSFLYHRHQARKVCLCEGHVWTRDFCDDLFCLRCGEDCQ